MLDQSGIISEPQKYESKNIYDPSGDYPEHPFEIRIGISFRQCLKPDGGKSARNDSIDLYDSYYEWDIAISCVFQYYETA